MNEAHLPSFKRDQIRSHIDLRISAHLKGYRQNLGIIGAEGLGKSHLLAEVYHSHASSAALIPLYLNLRTLDFDHLLDRWLTALLTSAVANRNIEPSLNFQALIQTAESFIPETVQKIRQLKKWFRKGERHTAAVRELFGLASSLAEETGKKILLMMDEFQELERLQVPDPFALLGKEIMVGKETLYIVTSSKPDRIREIFRHKLSLLFGNFEVIDMAPLGFDETVQFIHQRMPQPKLSSLQKKFLIRMTDGIPVYLERFLDRFSQSPVSSEDGSLSDENFILAFFEELIGPGGNLSLLFENRLSRCNRIAKDASVFIKALLAMSSGRRKILGIATFIERKTQDTKKILQRLVQEEIIHKRGSFYILEDYLYRFWLREVYQTVLHSHAPGSSEPHAHLLRALKEAFKRIEQEEKLDITGKVESLFREFRNDLVELNQKRTRFPQFSEIAFRPTNGRVFPLFARNPDVRWICQIANQPVQEEDVHFFMEDLKRFRKKVQRKIMITLAGIDQNAKLMAQAAEIQLWDLRNFNTLLDIYDLPKIIMMKE